MFFEYRADNDVYLSFVSVNLSGENVSRGEVFPSLRVKQHMELFQKGLLDN